MATTQYNQLAIAYKKLSGKSHTSVNFDPGNETIGSGVQISAFQAFGQDVSTTTAVRTGATLGNTYANASGETVVQYVRFTLTGIGTSLVLTEPGDISGTSIDDTGEISAAASLHHAYALALPSDYQSNSAYTHAKRGTFPFTANQSFSGSNGRLQVIPARFASGSIIDQFDPKVLKSDLTEITPGDPIDWVFDPFAGVLYVQDPSVSTVPAFIEGYLYIGNYISEIINNGTSFSGLTPYRAVYASSSTSITTEPLTNVRLLREFDPGSGNFGQILQAGINNAPTGAILDCTSYTGSQQITETVVFTKPISIRLGEINITASFASPTTQSHAFLIQGINGVSIEGLGRSPKADLLVSPTTIEMRTSGSGYHIFATGSNVLTFEGFDCYGIQSDNYNIRSGSGGICLIEPDPDVSGGGNNVNQVLLESVYVQGTRDHGIWVVGAILAQIRNCRVAQAGGHGFYVSTGTTSTYILNCYASSGELAGFCIDGSSYTQLQNCAAEFFGVGYWLRSSFNISLLGCGAEQNTPKTNVPNNLGIVFPNSLGSYAVNDIGSGFTNEFRGTNYLITGGRNIYIPVPYSKDPGDNAFATVVEYNGTRHYKIRGNARAVYLVNPRCTGDTPLRYDISIEDDGTNAPRDVNLFFNPVEDGTVHLLTQDIFTSSYATGTILTNTGRYIYTGSNSGPGAALSSSVILDQGDNTEIKNGTIYYTSLIANLQGTSSWANNSLQTVTASYAFTASYIDPIFISSSAAASGFGAGGGGGVTQITAGSNITIDPVGGTGNVTINSTGGGTNLGLVYAVSLGYLMP
jgi:hypothetical protein